MSSLLNNINSLLGALRLNSTSSQEIKIGEAGGDTNIYNSLYVGTTPIIGERNLTISNTNNGTGSYSILRLENDTSSTLSMFLNSSSKTTDGGIGNATIRNDGGELNLHGSSSIGINISDLGSITIENTTASNSSSTGALKLLGGLGISNTTNASSSTNGGSFTTAGGVSIAKDTYIGQNLTVSQNVTADTLTVNNFVQNYAPISLSSNVEFYGDSIVAGTNVLSTERWSYLVVTNYSKTEDNNAVADSQWVGDISIQVYDNHVSGNTAIIGLGLNDARFQPIESLYAISSCIESMCLFCTLPSSKIINARDISVTTVGSWTNNSAFSTIGSQTTDFGVAYKEVTVTGRYIGCSIISSTNNTTSSYGRYSLVVDGNTIVSSAPFTCSIITSTNGSNYISQLILYDTGVAGIGQSHTFRISINSAIGGFSSPVFVDYFFGFDKNVAGTSSVFLNSIPRYDPGHPVIGFGNNTFKQGLNKEYFIIANKFRKIYGLPVYYMCNTGEYSVPGMTSDLLLPLPSGHRWIASNIIDVIDNGEINYLSSS